MQVYKISLLTLGIFALTGAFTAQDVNAQTAEEKLKSVFETKFKAMDIDKDGSVSMNEFVESNQDNMVKMYMSLDKDGNGTVSGDEYISTQVKMGKPESKAREEFKELDPDNDGSYNAKEASRYVNNHLTSQFKKWDVDNNGKLTHDEFIADAMKELKSAQEEQAKAQK